MHHAQQSPLLTACQLDYYQIAAMHGQGATYNSIEYKMRPLRKLAATLVAEAANGDPSVAMKPSLDTPRMRPLKVTKARAKTSSPKKKSTKAAKAAEASFAGNLAEIDGAADSDASAVVDLGEPVKIESDTEDDAAVKVKEELPYGGAQDAGKAIDYKKLFGGSEENPGLDFVNELIKYEEQIDDDGLTPKSDLLKVASAWPSQTWFKDEDEA
jgi:hypothetical protein